MLAQDPIPTIFGRISPPPGPLSLYGDPIAGLSRLITVFIQLSLTIGALFLLIYAIWGAVDYITSEGDKERLGKARSKITNAFTGLLIMVASLTFYGIFVGDVLGILKKQSDGKWKFNIPMFDQTSTPVRQTGPTPRARSGFCPGVCRPDCQQGERAVGPADVCSTSRGQDRVCCIRR